MANDIRDKIIKAWNRFEEKNDKQPTKLHLTIDDETAIMDVLPKISPELAQKAFIEGVRVAVPKIFGFQVVYGADKFKVE